MPTLIETYGPFLGTVLAFRAATNVERPEYETFRRDVTAMLARAHHSAEEHSLDPKQYAHYAAVALIDETVNKSDWAGAAEWRKSTLQMAYYQNHLAGENFFKRLDEIQASGDPGMLELYYTCLCAGFEGMYRSDPAALATYRRRLFQELTRDGLREAPHLTESAYGRKLERELLRSHFPLWWLAPFVLGTMIAYTVFYLALWQQVAQIVERAG